MRGLHITTKSTRIRPNLRIGRRHDPFTVELPDCELFRCNFPPAPYEILLPKLQILAGDLKRVGYDGVWERIHPGEENMKTPLSGTAYARVTAPSGFRLAKRNEFFLTSDKWWNSETQRWEIFDGYGPRRTVAEILDQLRNEFDMVAYIAKPLSDQIDSRTVAMPPRHRQLWLREKIRRGDKYICDALSDWHRVQDALHGQLVKEPVYANGYARFCRAVRQRFQNWYVDEANGRPDGDGGWDAPWPSAEIAIEKIEQQATATGVCPHGIVWTVAGVPKYVYDLPEPPSQPFDGSQPQIDFFEECEQAMQNAKPPNATGAPGFAKPVDAIDPRVWEKFRNNPMELCATDSLEPVF